MIWIYLLIWMSVGAIIGYFAYEPLKRIEEQKRDNKGKRRMLDKWWIKSCDFCDWVWDMSNDWTVKETYVVNCGKIYCVDCWRKRQERLR